MKTLTNHTLGPRGINMRDGTTKWIEPGETIELDPKDVVGDLPDLGKRSDTAVAEDAGEIDALKAAVTDLAKQVEDLTKERDRLAKDKADLTQANADLAKQVEDLTKPAKG